MWNQKILIFNFSLMSASYIFGNWKMYLDYTESCILASQLAEATPEVGEATVALFPTDLAIADTKRILEGTPMLLGAQNCAWVPKGAYTGAVSAHMLADMGCAYILVGHSERRHVFGEDDNDVRKKIEACLDAGVVPVVCVGETKEEKETGKREYRLKKQVMKAFEGLEIDRDAQVIVAYEPVWAIGTGDACLPADADDIHGFLLQEIALYTQKNIPIIYGGSVTSENVVSYLSLKTVSGVLVGSASTSYASFCALVEASRAVS